MLNQKSDSIPALVINLGRSADRLAFQKTQLAALGIPMQRLAAISTDQVDAVHYESLANGWERKLRPAELACFLSHLEAWHHVSDLNQPWLILEDDALLSCEVPGLLAALSENSQQIDLVTLETRSRKKLIDKRAHRAGARFNLHRLYQDRTGAAAYVLYPSGARKLLQKTQTHAPGLADAFISSHYGLSAWQTVPAAAIQLDQCAAYGLPFGNPFSSTITPSGSERPEVCSFFQRMVFKARRLGSQLKMGLRQLSVIGSADRVLVMIDPNDFQLFASGAPREVGC